MKQVIPSKLKACEMIARRIVAESQAKGYNETDRFAVHLALDEALSNAVRHGNRGDEAKTITVDCSVGDDAIRLSVTDEGHGFDPRSVSDPTVDENLKRAEGRGLFLMKTYMDHVYFNAEGNCVILVKRKNSSLVAKKAAS